MADCKRDNGLAVSDIVLRPLETTFANDMTMAARDQHADLLMIYTHGRSGAETLLA